MATAIVKSKPYLFGISFAIEFVASVYLLLFDPLMKSLGPLHWVILLAYTVILSFFSLGYILSGSRKSLLVVGVFAALMFVAMLADGALGLPLSAAHHPGSAWSYLFGFGANGSTFGVSAAFTLMLVFAIVTAALSFYYYRK